MRILVSGGAGYIGSHAVLALRERGHQVVVVDDLSTGHEWATLGVELVKADICDREALETAFARGPFDAVLHFAARIRVDESVAQPLKYYRTNNLGTINLLDACVSHGVRDFVFSSTAATYGMPDVDLIPEDAPQAPINPYGFSKLVSERIITDSASAYDLRFVILRYFNVAGADPAGRIGQATPDASHLIKVAAEVVTGKRTGMTVFGTDYPTPDGTCIRDYIHVSDLAEAHVLAVEALANGTVRNETMNCGYGEGFSVLEVIDSVRRVTGADIEVTMGERRAGDPPRLVADASRISRILGWEPRYKELDTIVDHAIEWERRLTSSSLGTGSRQ